MAPYNGPNYEYTEFGHLPPKHQPLIYTTHVYVISATPEKCPLRPGYRVRGYRVWVRTRVICRSELEMSWEASGLPSMLLDHLIMDAHHYHHHHHHHRVACYRPRSRGDNTFGSVRVCACVSVCLWALSCLNRLTFDLDFWHEGRP